MSEKQPYPAACEDYDEDAGQEVPDTRHSASTRHHERSKPSRDKKTSSRSKKTPVDDAPPPSPRMTRPPSSSKAARKVEVVEDRSRKEKESRRKSAIEGGHKRSSSRQPSSREKEHTRRDDDPAYYGVRTQTSTQISPTKAIPIRPRPSPVATQSHGGGRPTSYSGSPYIDNPRAAPPLSHSAYSHHHRPSLSVGRSQPPPSPSHQSYAVHPPIQTDYFGSQPNNRTLAQRFDPPGSTSSAYGIRESVMRSSLPGSYPRQEDDGYGSAAEGAVMSNRRASIREPSRASLMKAEEDISRMPPPVLRPNIRQRAATEYSEARSPARTRHYAETHEYHEEALRRDPKRSSATYDLGRSTADYRLETANKGRRRQSYYGQSTSTGSSGTGYEDKFASAKAYQQDVAGEPVALTAELLKKQRRQAGSSHGTKSSDSRSRDESDYRRSATTRTTRSGSDGNNDNLTIKVNGQAHLVIGEARLELGQDGGEIHINRQSSLRNGSEKSNSEYGGPRRLDERKPRLEARPSGLSRMGSTNRSDGYGKRSSYSAAPRQHYEYYDDDDDASSYTDSNYF
ncbi:hypothetical protein PVAG01_04241 [Phlyctema vagabunda]|uniref:Uncharacterized protein n=1 Tax=Phlyctema vagabunda TaxID=108571 RepID=A0ABR4PNM8_9HELO